MDRATATVGDGCVAIAHGISAERIDRCCHRLDRSRERTIVGWLCSGGLAFLGPGACRNLASLLVTQLDGTHRHHEEMLEDDA
jgi:hypothetical protein